jgi:hypothetical protein
MLILPAPKRRHRRPPRSPALAAPLALMLVAASYDRTAHLNWVRLRFDRAVEIGGIDVAAVYVNDDDSDEAYIGGGSASLVTAQEVQVPLVILHGSTGPGTQLTVSAASGIIAADDGGTWAGVSALPLPFGAA